MPSIQKILENNRRWSRDVLRRDPHFFNRLSHQQAPRLMWIGCSDSRVPANSITGLDPGQVFVHRNIANLVIHTDLNCLSVLQFAVDVLKVDHIIVCGHYDCGGIKAALAARPLGLIDNWLRHIQDLQRINRGELKRCATPRERENRLTEMNVIEQTLNVAETTVVQAAWKRGQKLTVHGFIYDLKDGRLRDLGMPLSRRADLPAYRSGKRGEEGVRNVSRG